MYKKGIVSSGSTSARLESSARLIAKTHERLIDSSRVSCVIVGQPSNPILLPDSKSVKTSEIWGWRLSFPNFCYHKGSQLTASNNIWSTGIIIIPYYKDILGFYHLYCVWDTMFFISKARDISGICCLPQVGNLGNTESPASGTC